MDNSIYDLFSCIVIKSRIRLARNLTRYPFRIDDEYIAKGIVKDVERALVKCDDFSTYYMNTLSEVKLESLKERHLISQNLIDNKDFGAALINQDQSISVMVNEEDIIREQCFVNGFDLRGCYKKLEKVDEALSKNLDIAYDTQFGYLTACPTNLGTGMRASVMLFLPALTESGKIEELVKEMHQKGLTIRGIYGEGSEAEGYVYQISNEVTLGVSEYKILSEVERAVETICMVEREELVARYTKKDLITMDKSRKAFGVLTNAVLLGYSEFLGYVAQVKLGAMLGMIDISEIDKIDDLIIKVRPANLCVYYNKKMTAEDRDFHRAELVRETLNRLVNRG